MKGGRIVTTYDLTMFSKIPSSVLDELALWRHPTLLLLILCILIAT